MCSIEVADVIVSVLETKVQDDDVFTAYDVTKAARGLTTSNVRSSDVNKIVHNEYRTGQISNYQRELCSLELDNSPQAFVYFPNGKSAAEHSLVTEDEASEDDDGDDVFYVEGEGRLNIPKKILDQVSVTGGTYDFMVNGSLACRQKNANGAIRIGVKSYGLTGSKCKIEIDKTTNTINISAY